MKRCIIALSFVMGSLLVGNAHDITPDSPQKPVKKAVRSSDKRDVVCEESHEENDVNREDRTTLTVCRRRASDGS